MRGMYLAGEWVERDEIPICRPYDGEVVGSVPSATREEVERALYAAASGAKTMRALALADRVEILHRAAGLADSEMDRIAETISQEVGKPLAEARSEAARAGELLRLSASAAASACGETLPLDAGASGASKLGFTLRQPCGVVLAITPFNYPVLLVLHKVGPALAAGNAVLLKPSERTPLSALLLTELLLRAGLPPDGLQCLTGPGSQLGPQLCADRRVRKISFTGSSNVGEQIARIAGVKRLSLELGANCPTLVLRDADIEAAAAAVAHGGYVNAGQVCISVQRVLVERPVHRDFLDALMPRVAAIEPGDPRLESTALGPLISVAEAVRVERVLAAARDRGAQLLCGGEREGALMTPAVLDGVDPADSVSRDELFGPAVAVTQVNSVDEAIAAANDSRYGLGAGLFTRDVSAAMRFAREVDCGVLHINWTPLWRADPMPYGGLKASGIGKEGPRYALEEMTEMKTVVFHGV
jgi:acyl-CoA reductase-like NAD-dependent aldehyde dehydrogenase